MSLAVACNPDDQPRVPPPYLTIEQAAPLLGVGYRRVRQLCEEWKARGRAEKINGIWAIHPRADERLLRDRDLAARDLHQLAALRNGGVRARHITIAELRRDIVVDFKAYRLKHRSKTEEETRRLYIGQLMASGRMGVGCRIKKLSPRQLYEWQRGYADGGVAALVPKYPGSSGTGSIGEHAWEFFRKLRDGGTRKNQATAYTETAGHIARNHKEKQPGWEWPSLSTVRQRELKLDAGHRTVCDKGIRAYDAHHIPKATRDIEALASCEEWDGDERTLDVMYRVRDSRGWKPSRKIVISAWRDMRSRAIVGYIIAPYANSNTILGSVKNGIKEFGLPKILRTDWGKDYQKAMGIMHTKRWKVDDFDGPRVAHVLDRLNIECRPVTPYHPQSKPIESYFRGMKEHVDKTFPSFCGGSHAERREDFAKWCRGHLDELPTFEEVEAAVVKGIDIYNDTPHSAPDMFGYTPRYALEKFRDGPARKKSDDVLDFVFGEFIGPKLVRRDGIHWLGEVFGFGDHRMVNCQGRKLWLCIQPEDVHSVLVCDEEQRAMFHTNCGNNVIRTKRDLEEHQKMRARLRRGAFKIAREAKRAFQAIPPDEQLENRKAGLAAIHGKPLVPEAVPPLMSIDPDIEDALNKAGPAPSEGVSIAVRTGTEDLPLDDFLDDDPASSWASQLAAGVADDDGGGSLISLDDLTGE